jgi:hypothetical protein
MAGYSINGTLLPSAANTANQILWGVVSGSAVTDGVLYLADCTFDSASLGAGVKIELFRATGGIPTNFAVGTSAAPWGINKETSDAQAASSMASAWGSQGSSPVTATPTGLVVFRSWYVSPASGFLTQWSLNREVYMPAGTTDWIGLRISTPSGVSPNVAYNAAWSD